ncbi:MAG: 4-hydroxy-tetrahydrodipicolinate synthase [Verrucomicrobiota bacterium]
MTLHGCHTALITPFRNDTVCFDTLRTLIDRQLAGRVDGIVPMGTTGESPTVDFREHAQVIETVIEYVDKRCLVTAGTGANSTREAVQLTRDAAQAGANATLQVTPYYNKPTQEGLYRHFSTVADEGGLPVVLYNVPGRSGREIAVETIVRLARHPNIIAVKEAGGSVDRVNRILAECDIDIVSGDDSLTLPMMAVGGRGVISVASNIVPDRIHEMVHAALNGNWSGASEMHRLLYPLFRDLFIETNPIPIKAAMAMCGIIEEEYRLPLCPMAPANRAALEQTLRSLDIL